MSNQRDHVRRALRRAYLEEFGRFLKAGGTPGDMSGGTVRQRNAREAMARTLDQMFAIAPAPARPGPGCS